MLNDFCANRILFSQIGNKRLKVQHKQIRQGDNNPHHDGMRPPHPFQEGNSLPHMPIPGDHGAVQGYNLPPEVGLVETDSNLPVTESDLPVTSDREVAESSILDNLDSIGEALPNVSE